MPIAKLLHRFLDEVFLSPGRAHRANVECMPLAGRLGQSSDPAGLAQFLVAGRLGREESPIHDSPEGPASP